MSDYCTGKTVSLFKLRERKKCRGKPKIALAKEVKKDMSIMEVTKSIILDSIQW